MSLFTVQTRWSVYRDVVRVLFAALNGMIELDDPVRRLVPPFPRTRPEDWSDWTTAVFAFIAIDQQARLTDEALLNVAGMLAASETLAAKTAVPFPSVTDVEAVEHALRTINTRVKADQRFHAALDIGVALAADVRGRLAA